NPEPLARTPQPVPTRAPPPSTTPDKQKAAGSWFRALRVRGGQSPHNHGATTPDTRFARDSPSESGPRPRPRDAPLARRPASIAQTSAQAPESHGQTASSLHSVRQRDPVGQNH